MVNTTNNINLLHNKGVNMAILSKIVIALGLKLLKQSVVSELLIFAAKEIAKSTKFTWDDELVKIIEKGLNS